MFDSIGTDFHFLSPQFLWLLMPIAALVIYRVARDRLKNKAFSRTAIAPHLMALLITKSNSTKNTGPLLAVTMILVLIVIALAQPVWQHKNAETDHTSPLIIVMDQSLSMKQKDVSPNRNLRAQFLINRLFTHGVNRPISIVAVSGSTHILLPPTNDVELASLYLSYLSPELMPTEGGDAAQLAKRIKSTPSLNKQGTGLVLVTDGLQTGVSSLKKLLADNHISSVALAFTEMGKQTADELGIPVIQADRLPSNSMALINTVANMPLQANSDDNNWQDESFYLLLATASLILLWFRKGWTLNWSFMLLFCLLTPVQHAKASPIDWLLTKDQQAMIYVYNGNYQQAKALFDDTHWKAMSCYFTEDFKCAQNEFSKIGDVDSIFNMADAASQDGRYKTARELYKGLLTLQPKYPGAQHNLAIVEEIISKINGLSESYQSTNPPSKNGKPPPKDANEIADGSKKKVIGELPKSTLKAADILKSSAATEQWLRDISRDPRQFIRLKFLSEFNRDNEDMQ